ncbi:hypothetical protein ABTD78_20425, partial [Acinetobacter baumannii]
MGVDDRLNLIFQQTAELRAMHEEWRSGGGSGPVDDRLNRLEGRVDKVSDELGEVKVNLATLTERIA